MASTIFSRLKPPRKGWGQPSTARAAPCVTTSQSLAAVERLPKFERLAAMRPDARSPFHATAKRCFNCSRSPPTDARCIIPPEAVIIARRIPIPLFGAGLVEAIPDATILALADPDDRDGDGMSGRASVIRDVETGDPRVGRFGWKAQHATLLTFGADAYRNEMGITNDLFREELGFGVTAEQYRRCDPIPDPEDLIDPATRRRGIDNFASFMRFLAPVARESQTPAVQEGQRLFSALGCAVVPHAEHGHGSKCRPPVRSPGGAALLGSPAPRHRDRRRHPASGGQPGRDSHAIVVGSSPSPTASP